MKTRNHISISYKTGAHQPSQGHASSKLMALPSGVFAFISKVRQTGWGSFLWGQGIVRLHQAPPLCAFFCGMYLLPRCCLYSSIRLLTAKGKRHHTSVSDPGNGHMGIISLHLYPALTGRLPLRLLLEPSGVNVSPVCNSYKMAHAKQVVPLFLSIESLLHLLFENIHARSFLAVISAGSGKFYHHPNTTLYINLRLWFIGEGRTKKFSDLFHLVISSR